jgi:hypothetical protein
LLKFKNEKYVAKSATTNNGIFFYLLPVEVRILTAI